MVDATIPLSTPTRTVLMSWPMVVTGLGGPGMLAIGSGLIWPMTAALGGVCDLIGIASIVVFLGLAEG